jgi:DNA repair exonuclease SbcCD ATPase subunit
MQYLKFVFIVVLSFVSVATGWAQQPAKVRKPVKNPPQYPNIIDMEGQSAPAVKPATPPAETTQAAPVATELTANEALVRALQSLTGEVRTLVGELRSMNLRQQAQLEMTRLTRLDLRIDHYERELKPIRERLAALEVEDQQLSTLMTRESLYAQTQTIGTIDRDATMRQLKQQHEYRQNLVRNEKDRLKQIETELVKQLTAVRASENEAEQRLQQTESELKRGNNN